MNTFDSLPRDLKYEILHKLYIQDIMKYYITSKTRQVDDKQLIMNIYSEYNYYFNITYNNQYTIDHKINLLFIGYVEYLKLVKAFKENNRIPMFIICFAGESNKLIFNKIDLTLTIPKNANTDLVNYLESKTGSKNIKFNLKFTNLNEMILFIKEMYDKLLMFVKVCGCPALCLVGIITMSVKNLFNTT